MKLTIVCYPKCGTCRKAVKWLEERGIGDIKLDNPQREELAAGTK